MSADFLLSGVRINDLICIKDHLNDSDELQACAHCTSQILLHSFLSLLMVVADVCEPVSDHTAPHSVVVATLADITPQHCLTQCALPLQPPAGDTIDPSSSTSLSRVERREL